MTDAARTILDQALSLTDDERLRLAEALFDSLPADAQEQIDRAWREEVQRRMNEVRRGEVELESWDEVRRAGREALTR
ncbi:MAG: addiction module protein [Myxococcales bacterium]|nr:addiction module protein [Myxococcales bacterium]MCA9698540.1 addiction module protein [Myxococcales bacterium]